MSDLIKRPTAAVAKRLRTTHIPIGEPEADKPIDLRQYYLLLLRRKWLILAVAFSITAAVTLQVYTTTPLFTATVRVQIDPEATNVLPYDDPFQSSLYFLATDSYIRTQAELLRSRGLALRVVNELDLLNNEVFKKPVSAGVFTSLFAEISKFARNLVKSVLGIGEVASKVAEGPAEKAEQMAASLQSGINVALIRGTRLMEISYTTHNAELASRIVNSAAEQYVELNLEKRFKATTKASEFLEKKLIDLQAKVEDSQQKLIDYADRNNIVNLDERKNITFEKLESLNQELTTVESKLISIEASYEALEDANIENFPQTLRTPLISVLEEKLFNLEQSLARLSASFGPDWPEVAQTNREIETVRKQLVKEKRETIDRTRFEYQTALNHARKLKEALETQKDRANVLYSASIQYDILKREADTNEELYEGLLQRLKQAGISAGLRSSNIHLVDTSQPPQFASYPAKSRSMMIGAMLGLILGVGLALLIEYIDNTVKTPEDLEQHLGLPTLTVIPSLEKVIPNRMVPALAGSDPEVISRYLESPRSQLWEAYRSLRTSILLSHSGKPPQVILVTSALPGEGKTTTSVHTGIVLAQTNARTLLIDLDMRKPALARMAGVDGSHGMSNYLSGNSDLSSQIQATRVPNLFAISAGPNPPNPAELIGSERMETGINLLRDYFKYVVIDSPPILSVTDASILSTIVDGVVLVIHGGKTPRDAVGKAFDRLNAVGAQVLGGMINNVDIAKSDYSYYYRYYHHDQYYDDRSAAGSQEVG